MRKFLDEEMSAKTMPYFNLLPVELIFHIFNYLDAETILLSLRHVCQRFYVISNVYNEYQVNLRSCRKWNFYRFCRVLNPGNLQSLILSDDDQTPGQISLFLSYFQLNQFHSLRSLTLLEIDDTNLDILAKDFPFLPLTCLTIQSRTFFTWSTETLACLSNILEQSSLKRFTLSIWCFEIYHFLWPNQCSIEYLHISNRITYEQYCTILEQCLFLRTLTIKDVLWNDTSTMNTNHYRQLKSLTLEDNRMDIFKLEQFLSLTPSLNYLKVIGMAYLIDSYRWEKILRIKLPNLDKFEFFFLSWKDVNYNFSDIQSLIRPFQTSFWLENKHWLVNCDYILNPMEVMIYSIPICNPYFQYHDPSNKISCSNTTKLNCDRIMMDRISELRLNLVKTICDCNALHKNELSPYTLFPNVTTLTVDLDDKCPLSLSLTLSNLINLAYLRRLVLNLNYDLTSDLNTTTNLIRIFKQTSQLHTMEIHKNSSFLSCSTTIEDICSLIPSSIQHLKIVVKNINEMKIIFDRLNYLSSITFQFASCKSIPSAKMIESFLNIKKDLTYRKDDCSIRVWLNHFPKNQPTLI